MTRCVFVINTPPNSLDNSVLERELLECKILKKNCLEELFFIQKKKTIKTKQNESAASTEIQRRRQRCVH